MPDTLSVHEQMFVGRVAELVTFRQALAGGPAAPVMLYLHGRAGIGKTALMHRFADEAAAEGYAIVRVGGQDVAACRTAFETAARAAFDKDRVLLLVDGFEHCQGLETWLRTSFLPRLPEGTLIVVAGRRPPGRQWRSDPGWSFPVLRTIALGELPRPVAARLLDAHGVPAELQPGVLAAAGGNPLALTLAAELAVRDHGWQPGEDIAYTFLMALFHDAPSRSHGSALGLFAHARTVTVDLVRAAFPDEDADALYDWLRDLPFVRSDRRGLYSPELVRHALRRDTDGGAGAHQEMHRRALRHLVDNVRSGHEPAAMSEVTQYIRSMGDMAPRYVSHSGDHRLYEDTYRPEDHSALVGMARCAEGEETARLVAYWLARQPQNVTVYRDYDSGRPSAFMVRLSFATEDPGELEADPVVAAAWAHCRAADGLGEDEHFGVVRFLIDPSAPRRPSDAMDMMLQHCLTAVMREPGLARSYSTWSDPDYWAAMLEFADCHPVPGGEHVFDGRRHVLYAHDWRLVPLPRWVDGLPME
ncbi:hypothetical protein [Amycolatopsis pithecellobii]|uniref:Uncharacterized protein n=1 Tax=Amycolatopsis pithecellobii TaxID=664692 RepID=A0A6N7YTQ9_9PSEU|nr:hypothetical protein [Amycolatopsis pithecellobii]MTD56425.1 hypothetical protein [Amycolatopsis pithecellobii]